MKALSELNTKTIKTIFTDIDDTLTLNGQLPANSYQALWELHSKGIQIVPVTGRPAGWCEMIARMWPVHGVIGENGGFYFRYHEKKMNRYYAQPEPVRLENQKKLMVIKNQVLSEVPGCAIASDQFCRQLDLAVDFCEDVPPLSKTDINKIVSIFSKHGAQAKVSSIHVNGWFGEHNKLSMCETYFKNEMNKNLSDHQHEICFVGDSPNDEPMFEFFDNSIAVANIKEFLDDLTHKPNYIASDDGADGFCDFAKLFT